MSRADKAFQRQLEGYSLATAEITYRMPDAQSLLQDVISCGVEDLPDGLARPGVYCTLAENELRKKM